MLGASSAYLPTLKSFARTYHFELRVLGLCSILAVIGFHPKSGLVSIKDLAIIQSFKAYTSINTALSENEKINLEEIVARTMNYSYTDTQLGFYLKDLKFFDHYNKAEVEQKILATLPGRLRTKAQNYLRAVLILAEKHQVDPIWVLSVMWTESHFDYSAKSWAGARGLMQIMPETRKFVYRQYKSNKRKLVVEESGFKINRFFPYAVKENDRVRHVRKLVNIELGIIYLKKLLRTFKDHKYATVAYNMGPGWTQSRLRNKLPVGDDNLYLDKVQAAYKQITTKI